MKNRTIIKIIICLAVFALPLPGLAMTQAQRQALINQIQQQINYLLLQVYQMMASQAGTSGCYASWSCTQWSICKNKIQTRICTDYEKCGSQKNKPLESQSCEDLWVDIKANSQDGAIYVSNKYPFAISWNSAGAVSCFAQESWAGSKPTSGAFQASVEFDPQAVYSITCSDQYGNQATDTVVVNFK